MYDNIDLKNNIFAFGFQTKEQLKMFEKQAHKIVSIDATHKTNQYKFQLINLVVPDEFNKGYAAAHLICNREDELVRIPFFQAIKERCSNPIIAINAVMTDDDNSGWNAFLRVFGDCTQLLCKWHVKRAWGNKIPLCGSKQLQEEVYRTLEVILEETLEKMPVGFLRKYEDICPKFVNYFKNTNVSRPVKWGMCYRQFEHVNTDTNMFVESFHNSLKTFYLERMPNKRIDDLINILLEIEADDYWSRKRRIVYLDVPKKDIDSDIRYKRGINIPDAHMTALSKSKRSAQSQSKNVTYRINQITENCNCQLGKQQISSVDLCEHIYSCNCNDKAKIC